MRRRLGILFDGTLIAAALVLFSGFMTQVVYSPVDPCGMGGNLLWSLIWGCW